MVSGAFLRKGRRNESPISTISQKNFATDNLSGWALPTGGTGSISLSGGVLNLSGGNGGFSNYIYYTGDSYNFTSLEKWKIEVTFRTPNPVTTNSYGFSVGVASTHNNSLYRVTTANWMKLSGDAGTLGRFSRFCINGGAQTQSANGGSNGLLSNNTVYTLTVERNKNTITFNLYNGVGTTGSTARSSFSTDFNITSQNSNSIAHNTGRFAIWNNGGSFSISRIKLSSDAQKNVDVVFVGDSNMYGMYAGSNSVRYVEQAATTAGLSFEVLAGAADTTTEVLSRVNEIINLKPRVVYLNTLSNDVALSQDYTTSYPTLVNTLKREGIVVVHGTPIARDAANMTTVSAWIASTFPQDRIVDLFTLTKSGINLNNSYDIGDNVHLNAAGNNTCDDTLFNIIKVF